MNENFYINEKASFKSTTNNLGEIRSFVGKILEQIDIPSDEKDNIILAVDEACTNIIKHAYKLSPDGDIILNITVRNSELAIKIVDYGLSFEPDTVPVPDIKELYRQHKVGGLGLHLIKSLMDDVKFKIIPGVRNEVSLKKKIAQKSISRI